MIRKMTRDELGQDDQIGDEDPHIKTMTVDMKGCWIFQSALINEGIHSIRVQQYEHDLRKTVVSSRCDKMLSQPCRFVRYYNSGEAGRPATIAALSHVGPFHSVMIDELR
jgi:hypothetical protein